MVNFVSLSCPKCGGELEFKGNLAKCGNCRKPYALVSDGQRDGKIQVSYLALGVNDGTMQVCLKIRIADFLKTATNYLIVDGEPYREYLSIKDGEVVCDKSIRDSHVALTVGMGTVEKEWVVEGFFCTRKEVTVSSFTSMLTIRVEEIEDGNEITVGEIVKIVVDDRKYTEQANEISRLIQAEFGVVPNVRLDQG